MAERGNLGIHIGVERKGFQDGVQFIVALYLEYADICEATDDAPEMFRLARPLEFRRALVLELPQALDGGSIHLIRDPDFYLNLKEHERLSILDWVGVQAARAVVEVVSRQRPLS
jgi:hypothetical protein